MHQPSTTAFDQRPLPIDRSGRLLMFVMRRIASAGLDDAHAANAMLCHFGMHYRRPLVLLRAMMAEIARGSRRTIAVAPCCCARMTSDEAMLLRAVEAANATTQSAHLLLTDLMGTSDCLGALTTAQAVSQSFADLGKPLGMFSERG